MGDSKKHALISPSAFSRIGLCPASVLLSKDIPEKESTYAAEGTRAHRLAELTVKYGLFEEPLTESELDELRESQADREMLGHVNAYFDCIASYMGNDVYFKGTEVRLPITPITGEPDAFGTADCIVIKAKTLHIFDLKYGAGVKVAAKQNVQLSIYALAALAELDPEGMFYGIEAVCLHIVQPRMDNIDVWPVARAGLEGSFLSNVRRSSERALHLVEHPEDLQVNYPFVVVPGATPRGDFAKPNEDICRFCKAKATCPIVKQVMHEALEQDFEDLPATVEPKAELPAEVVQQIHEIPVPDTPERLAKAYSWIPVIKQWIDAVEARMHARLTDNGAFGGYKLVSGRTGPRKWADEAEAEAILRRALTIDKAYARKIITPTVAEKLMKQHEIGPKYWKQLSALIERSAGKPSIAPEDDPRPALTPQIESDFEDLETETKAE